MEELFDNLEKKLKVLLDQHSHAKNTNKQLYQSKLLLLREKENLLEKQHKAIVQIESLIARLKSLEKLP